MTDRAYVIEEFRDLPGEVEILAIGKVRQPSGDAQEFEVSVVLASDLDAPDFNPETDRHICWVGCGQLDLLKVGSRWREGRWIGDTKDFILEGSFGCLGNEGLGAGIDPPSGSIRRFPVLTTMSSPGFLLRRISGSSTSGRKPPRVLLLPKPELLRALFGVSSRVLIGMFDGLREANALPDQYLMRRSRSSLGSDGTVRIVSGTRLDDHEAVLAALLVTDESIRRLHDQVFQQMSVRREWRNGTPVAPQVDWPWSRPIRMSVAGRWFQRETGAPRFLITRIRSIEVTPTFRRIELHYPSTRQDGDSPGPRPRGRPRSSRAPVVLLTRGRAPSPARRPRNISSDRLSFDGLQEIEIIAIPRVSYVPGGADDLWEDPRDETPSSTAPRQKGADKDVGGSRASRGDRVEEDPDHEWAQRLLNEALQKTWTALGIACAEARWSLRSVKTARSVPVAGATTAAIPDAGPMLAIVAAETAMVMVIDYGSCSGDERSLGILKAPYAGDETRMARDVEEIGRACGGRWRSPSLDTRGFELFAANRRPEVWADPALYAALLKRKLVAALGV